MEMKEQDYMSQRVDDQINWLEKKSAHNQKWYKRNKSLIIIASVSIPFMAGFIEEGEEVTIMKILIAIAGPRSETAGDRTRPQCARQSRGARPRAR